MKTLIWFGVLLALALLGDVASMPGATPPLLTGQPGDTDKLSYGLGLRVAMVLSAQNIPIDREAFLRGLKDGGRNPGHPSADARDCKAGMQVQVNAAPCTEAQSLGAKGLYRGNALFIWYGKKGNTPAGLRY